MRLADVLRVLHQIHKDTTRLLFEAPVNESEAIRSAVAKADLALGNAVSLVRESLSRSQGVNPACAEVKRNGQNGTAASQTSTRIPGKKVASCQGIGSSNIKEPATQAASALPEDGLPDDEYTVKLEQSSWEYLDTIEHPSDRPNPRAA